MKKALALALALLGGCEAGIIQEVRQRAAFDFGCEEDDIEVVEINQHTRGAVGCGKRAAYVRVQGTLNNWVRNGEIARERPGASRASND